MTTSGKRLLAAVLLLAVAPAWAQTPPIKVENAWARATAPAAKSGAAFLTITDTGPADKLVGVASPVAGMVQLHQTIEQSGVMKMEPVAALRLETGKPVELKPGSYHIMLMDLHGQLKQGDTFPVTLSFANAAPVTATVTVGPAGASGPAHDMPHMNMGGAPATSKP
jgi:copper(I)-binding protein